MHQDAAGTKLLTLHLQVGGAGRVAAEHAVGRPQDVAGTFLFLCSDLSAYTTGAVLDVNGGMLIH